MVRKRDTLIDTLMELDESGSKGGKKGTQVSISEEIEKEEVEKEEKKEEPEKRSIKKI